MHASNFQLQDYLQRIEFPHTVRAELASLGAVMRQHLLTIVFEKAGCMCVASV